MELLDLLAQGHNQAALNNNNSSSAILKEIAALGERFERAVAAALLSVGGTVHGPTEDARYVIFQATDEEIQERLDNGKLSGFGNAFFKDQIDPAFIPFYEKLKEEEPDIWNRLERLADLIEERKGKRLYPNAAAATGIMAQLMNFAPGTEIGLLIQCRLGAWAQLWSEFRP